MSADAFRTSAVVHEASRDHVFHGVTGCLVHRHLVRELATWPRTRQHFADLGQTVEIKTLQFACACGRRVGGGSPPFDEDAALGKCVGTELRAEGTAHRTYVGASLQPLA